MGCTRNGCLAILVLASTGCHSPQAVAAFAASAEQAIEHGAPLFRDLYGSCVRARLDRQPVKPVFKGRTAPEPDAVCARFRSQGDALVTDSAAFSAYFGAIHQLAAFGASGVTALSTNAAMQAAATANLTASQITAVGKLAGIVTRAAEEHYRRSHLIRYLREANPSVAEAAQAFATIARDYEGLLEEERRALRTRYQDVSVSADAATILLLNHAYTQDMQQIDRHKAAAEAYIAALQEIADDHQKLASNSVKSLDLSKLNRLLSEPRPLGSGF